ncbi:hypothetical protein [Streptosporangium sp. NPDC051022]|uniref:hypothetical protein n=1 Tax=Streptosporangium sp. NPDC051022 TaxID=3155752 RepID=UPI0034235B2D
MTPSRKPSRATVITASIAIGVFGAGAGLGTVIAARSGQPAQEQVIRLAAGTYHLDAGAQAWTAGKVGDGNAPLPLSGANGGGAIGNKGAGQGSTGAKVCLTATADGRAVSGGGGGCLALPVLASAIAPLQRPGNPRGTATKDPVPQPNSTAAVEPVKNTSSQKSNGNSGSNGNGGGGGGGGGGGTQKAPNPAPVQPPTTTTTRKTAPDPAPTKKVSGNISDSGSQIDKGPAVLAEKPKVDVGVPAQPKDTGGQGTKQSAPSGTLKPAVPTSTAKPTEPSETAKPTTPRATPKPSGTARRPVPTATPRSPGRHRSPQRNAAPTPHSTLNPAPPTADPTLPTPDRRQPADGTVLRPADPPTQNGTLPEGADSLPVFKDPALLRRAQEALGLDKNMRYTDENGVWDLNIAPPGTPPCRDYSTDELRELGSTEQNPIIPRDSCLWPAFVRWLYAEPAPGEVSNWTKFTGLPERNLDFVVTDPAPAQPNPADQPGQPGQSGQPDRSGRSGPAQSVPPARSGDLAPAVPTPYDQEPPVRYGGSDPAQSTRSNQSDRPSGDLPPAQPSRPDRRGSGHINPGPGQIEPEQDGYRGP